MRNVMPHDKRVEVVEVSTGLYKAFLHRNHEPFQVGEDEDRRTEYRCETVVSGPTSFASGDDALAFFTEHQDAIMDDRLAWEAVGKAAKDADVARAKLVATDYEVIKAMEEFLASQGITIPGRDEAEDWRQMIRDYRSLVG